jgi:Fe-S-cluster containining protein
VDRNASQRGALRAISPGATKLQDNRLAVELDCGSVRLGVCSNHGACHDKQGMVSRFPTRRDHKLIQIVDSVLAEAARRSGEWLLCRPGCTQCCVGVFSINQLDAFRLRRGLADLEKRAPERATRIRQRARESVGRLMPQFPGDPVSGLLYDTEDASQSFADFTNDEPCPVLDPETGNCELYESRPMICRVFGPPVQSEEGLCVCELCFQGASTEQIAACEMKPDPDDLESSLLQELEKNTGARGNTIVAFCLAS